MKKLALIIGVGLLSLSISSVYATPKSGGGKKADASKVVVVVVPVNPKSNSVEVARIKAAAATAPKYRDLNPVTRVNYSYQNTKTQEKQKKF